jgi:hypothetical protein
MAKEVEVADSAGEVVSQLETVAAALENGLAARLSNLGKAGADWDAFQTVLGTHQLTAWSLALIGIGAFVVALLLSHAGLYLIERRAARAAGWRRGVGLLASSLLALVIMMLLTRLAVNDETIRTVVRFWVLAGLIFFLTRAGLIFVIKAHQSDDPAASAAAVKAFSANLAFAVLWALVGIALSMALRVLGAGPGLLDLGRIALTFVLLLLLVSAYWRFRNTVRAVIVSPHPDSVFLRKLAAMWPWIAMLFTILTVVGSQAATTIGKPLPPPGDLHHAAAGAAGAAPGHGRGRLGRTRPGIARSHRSVGGLAAHLSFSGAGGNLFTSGLFLGRAGADRGRARAWDHRRPCG